MENPEYPAVKENGSSATSAQTTSFSPIVEEVTVKGPENFMGEFDDDDNLQHSLMTSIKSRSCKGSANFLDDSSLELSESSDEEVEFTADNKPGTPDDDRQNVNVSTNLRSTDRSKSTAKKASGKEINKEQKKRGKASSRGSFKCPHICGRSFSSMASLNQHVRWTCGSEPSFCCMQCDCRFYLKNQLKTHVFGVHNNVKSSKLASELGPAGN